MDIKKLSYLIVFLFFITSFQTGFSQSQKSRAQLKIAEKYYKRLHYLSAIQYLKPLLNVDSTQVVAQEIIANSYRNLR